MKQEVRNLVLTVIVLIMFTSMYGCNKAENPVSSTPPVETGQIFYKDSIVINALILDSLYTSSGFINSTFNNNDSIVIEYKYKSTYAAQCYSSLNIATPNVTLYTMDLSATPEYLTYKNGFKLNLIQSYDKLIYNVTAISHNNNVSLQTIVKDFYVYKK